MNQLTIIGNLTHDPESRIIKTNDGGANVCTFTVAVNGRNNQSEFFRVTAWRKLAELCQQYLLKGRKVCIVGPVTARCYQANNGEWRTSLEVNAQSVEFLSPKEQQGDADDSQFINTAPTAQVPSNWPTPGPGVIPVENPDDLPF